MYQIILDEEEYQIILRHRDKIKQQQELFNKQKNCKHVWSKTGWGHNGDIYECSICGKIGC